MRGLIGNIRNEIKIRDTDFVIFMLAPLGAWLFGNILLSSIVFFVEPQDGWFSMGLMMSLICAVIMVFAVGIVQGTMSFDIAVSMGQRRIDYYWANFFATLLEGMAALAVALLLGVLERYFIYESCLSRNMEMEIDLLKWVAPWGVPVLITLCAVTSFVGCLLQRFGKPVGVVLGVMGVALCWSAPAFEFVSEAKKGTLLHAIYQGIKNIAAWMTAERALIVMAASVVSFLLLGHILVKKTAVRQ